jgi:hypothetical protein
MITILPTVLWMISMRGFIIKYNGNLSRGANWFMSQVYDYSEINKICKKEKIEKPISAKLWIILIISWLPGIIILFNLLP